MPYVNGGTTTLQQTSNASLVNRAASMTGTEAFEFIRSCVSHAPTDVRRARAQSFLNGGVDWEIVWREAIRHRAVTSFCRHLNVLVGEQLPAPVQEEIQEQQRAVRIHNTFLVEELGTVVRRFEEEDLPILTIKGPVLAQEAYGDVAYRQYVDLDVIIPPDRFVEAERLLKSIGYACKPDRAHLSEWQKKMEIRLSGQWPLKRGNGTFSIDLHTRTLPSGYTTTPDFEAFWDRSREIRLNGSVPVRALSAEDMVLTLCHQGIKDQWRVLRHGCDIGEFIRSNPGIDWKKAVQIARRNGGASVLKLGLFMAQAVLGTSLPTDVRTWIGDDPSTERIGTMMTAFLENQHRESELPYGRRVRFQLATKDSIGGKVRYIIHSVVQHIYSDLLSSSPTD